MGDFHPIIERFSAEYDLIHNAEVYPYGDAEAVMDYEMFDALAERFGRNFIGFVGGLHYQFKPERTVPAGVVAVPERNHDEPTVLLIQR